MKEKFRSSHVAENFRQSITPTGYQPKGSSSKDSFPLILLFVALMIAGIAITITFHFPILHFWVSICLMMILLVFLTLLLNAFPPFLNQFSLKAPILGLGSAVLFFGICFVGIRLISWILPGMGEYIQAIFLWKGDISPIWIILILVLIAAPGEEIFWRGFIQRTLYPYLGGGGSVLTAAIFYGVLHLLSGNPALALAAFFGGLFWGGIYLWRDDLWICIFSHSIWSILAFFLLPIL